MNKIVLSNLGHTWLLDLDGTIVLHNGYKINNEDTFLDRAKEFLETIPEQDYIIFLTSRREEYRERTERFLVEHNIRYNQIIFNLPYGERILINDKKPSGLRMSIAVNTERDQFYTGDFVIDEDL